ncbi:unnamed protein product [Cyprideis torosa]|uniref:CREG-like beta-barrel domain-containing protein n=1 Tax=Cyprideis torosa TaxID=163714 RepID=A0A7R8WGH7_9CRUS|nr:unnamed protein product [Cyprideis torosa]CAG0898089.1 unnamed protein product [Cyprideis torosa]
MLSSVAIVLCLLGVVGQAASVGTSDNGVPKKTDFSRFYYRVWQSLDEGVSLHDEPPPHEQVAKMARYIAHATVLMVMHFPRENVYTIHLSCSPDWASIATLSTRAPTQGLPFSNVVAISDGLSPVNDTGNGVPYMYITDMDVSAKDILENPHVSMSVTLAATDYCTLHKYDPESPLCARVIFNGIVQRLAEGSEEAELARKSLFSRHPAMENWPQDHHFYFAKIVILEVFVLDFFGGIQHLTPDEYFHPA